MAVKWRKWNKAIHRDIGYFFFAMTLIYAISGIALNHLDDWDPNYIVTTKQFLVPLKVGKPDKQGVLNILSKIDEKDNYKKHYFPGGDYLKVFIKNGTVTIDLKTGKGILEKTKRRPLFAEVDYLHYNPVKYWTWFSDIYAVALILLAITGIIIPRGKTGVAKRGIWYIIAGLVIPVVFLLIYFY
jgi:hypothetical protein